MPHGAFGPWLRRKLADKEINGSEFAERIGKRPSVVSRWLRGERIPSPSSCDLVADVLNVSIDECLAVAGHRPRMDPIPEGDPRIELHGLIDRIDWALLGPTFVSMAVGTLEQMRKESIRLKREAAEPASR